MFVKPREGVRVRDPDTRQHLPDEGREVQLSAYWLRRRADGDVVELNPIPEHAKSSEGEQA